MELSRELGQLRRTVEAELLQVGQRFVMARATMEPADLDLALLETQRDINDEAIWGILTERQEARKRAELRRVGDMQVLRSLEREKMHKEEE